MHEFDQVVMVVKAMVIVKKMVITMVIVIVMVKTMVMVVKKTNNGNGNDTSDNCGGEQFQIQETNRTPVHATSWQIIGCTGSP